MDPILDLQRAVIARLRDYAPLAALVGGRIYDEPPRDQGGTVSVKLPYVSLGPSNYVSERADCIRGGEIMLQIDVWSEKPGHVEVRSVAHAVRSAFDGYEIPLSDNALVSFEHWRTDEPQSGALKHASIRFTAIVEEH